MTLGQQIAWDDVFFVLDFLQLFLSLPFFFSCASFCVYTLQFFTVSFSTFLYSFFFAFSFFSLIF